MSRLKFLCALSLTALFVCRLPAAEEKVVPSDVLVIGDSMMKAVARGFRKSLATEKLSCARFSSIGSGLARLDLLDWHVRGEALVKAATPKVAIVMMGANDNQPLKSSGAVIPFGSDLWATEYGRRAGKLMDLLLAGGCQHLFWIGLPRMREASLDRDVQMINRIAEQQARSREEVTFFPTATLFANAKGHYSAYIRQKNGMPLDVRASDGIHLNRNGAEHLAKTMTPLVVDSIKR